MAACPGAFWSGVLRGQNQVAPSVEASLGPGSARELRKSCGRVAVPRQPIGRRLQRSVFCRCSPDVTESAQPATSLSDLQNLLELAIKSENYSEAAQLRDVIQKRQQDSRSAVEEANRRFYECFSKRDFQGMSEIWGEGQHVQCIHPGAACIAGRSEVLRGWELIFQGGPMDIILEDVRIFLNDNLAVVTCREMIYAGESTGRLTATNIFEKQNGRWVIVHHHGAAWLL